MTGFQEAYKRGCEAFRRFRAMAMPDEAATLNPYASVSIEGRAWRKGWDDVRLGLLSLEEREDAHAHDLIAEVHRLKRGG